MRITVCNFARKPEYSVLVLIKDVLIKDVMIKDGYMFGEKNLKHHCRIFLRFIIKPVSTTLHVSLPKCTRHVKNCRPFHLNIPCLTEVYKHAKSVFSCYRHYRNNFPLSSLKALVTNMRRERKDDLNVCTTQKLNEERGGRKERRQRKRDGQADHPL